MLSGFKTFIARGNVVDLAVGVVMGAAFGLVVSGLVESFINPLIAWLVGKPNFDSLMFSLPPLIGEEPTVFQYGKILTAIVNFFLVSLAIYFCLWNESSCWHRRNENVRLGYSRFACKKN